MSSSLLACGIEEVAYYLRLVLSDIFFLKIAKFGFISFLRVICSKSWFSILWWESLDRFLQFRPGSGASALLN